MTTILRICLTAILIAVTHSAHAVTVMVMGLGPNQAQLLIDQTTVRVMRPGSRSPEGVRLISIKGNEARIEANGVVHSLGLGQSIVSSLVVQADRGGHFYTDITVNGRKAKAVVDTGASIVAFSRSEADRLGLNYRNGKRAKMWTAGGNVDTYAITLDKLLVGSMPLRNVEAVVNSLSDSPPVVLLGMTALNQFKVITEGDRLHLIPKK